MSKKFESELGKPRVHTCPIVDNIINDIVDMKARVLKVFTMETHDGNQNLEDIRLTIEQVLDIEVTNILTALNRTKYYNVMLSGMHYVAINALHGVKELIESPEAQVDPDTMTEVRKDLKSK